nr:zinc finger, RING-CH-type [Tanacetum cinerariifolium]
MTVITNVASYIISLILSALARIGLFKSPDPDDHISGGAVSYVLILDGTSPSLQPIPIHVVTAAIKDKVNMIRYEDYVCPYVGSEVFCTNKRAIDDASHDKATMFKVKALEVADEGKDGEVEEDGEEEADEGNDGEGEEEADEGYGSGSEEEYDEGNDGYMTQMQEHKHPKHEAKLRSHISKLKWQTAKNHVDYKVFVMLHMETYNGDPIAKWDVGLCEESKKQVSLLRRVRFKNSTKILLHKFNVDAENMFDLAYKRM